MIKQTFTEKLVILWNSP